MPRLHLQKRAKCISILFLFVCLKACFAVDHWEALVLPSDVWRYFVGVSEPPADWPAPEFPDSAWKEGRAGIGYGDGDDATVIGLAVSVYLRRSFEVTDLSKIEQLSFQMDYDDAFVAYLNGREIARSAGLTGDRPSFQRVSTVNHEAVLYQGGVPDAYAVDSALLRRGVNVLAVQVHNVDAGSSDLSAIPFLFAGIPDAERVYQPTPSWFSAPFVFESSDIPIVLIDTQGQAIPNEPKLTARMSVIDNGNGARNRLTDVPNGYGGWIGIEMRGNASQDYGVVQGKWSYTLETRNEDGSNRNVGLLGMPEDNDWILNAEFIDKTLMRDAVAYWMSRSVGRWAPRVRHVELVVNGKYEGVYLLLEKIKPGKNRLDVAEMDSADVAGDSVTGGYIWDVQQADLTDVVFGNNGNQRVLKYPKPDKVRPEQLAYITRVNDELQDLVTRSYFGDPLTGYRAYIDVSTFVDELIVQEATRNSDAYGWSGFFHKDRMARICAGPVWDFDQSMANSTYNEGDIVGRWTIEDYDASMPRIWLKLWSDTAFKSQTVDAWFGYRGGPLRTDRVFAFIDSVAEYLNEAQQRNFQRWPILGVGIWRSVDGFEERDTYQKEVDFMKRYLEEHMEWMDAELSRFSGIGERGMTDAAAPAVTLAPNPFHDQTAVQVVLPGDGMVEVRVFDVLGRLVRTKQLGYGWRGILRFSWDGRDDAGRTVAAGLYFYAIDQNGLHRQRVKAIKF
jgi:hypothetical protein